MKKSENEYSLPQVSYFCISCVSAISLSCFIISTESRILLKNMIFPFLWVGCVEIHHFVSVVSCGYKNETLMAFHSECCSEASATEFLKTLSMYSY